MVFKRRIQRTYAQAFSQGLFPRGGWRRAVSYVLHRMRRLPDPPHRIARGIAAGIFLCFTPFFGFHIFFAMALAFVMQGNIMAAIMATFFGNPITFPIIATVALELGAWMLGLPGGMQFPNVVSEFSQAATELWQNLMAIFTDEVANWDRLGRFYRHIFKPYLVGGIVLGVFAGVAAYVISRPLIAAYQKRRIKRLKKKYQKRRDADAAKADAAAE